MNENIQISSRQYAWMVAVVLTSGGLYLLPSDLAKLAYKDAWFSYIISLFISLGIAYIFYRLAKLYPEKNLMEINKEVLGKVLGGFVNFLFVFQLWIIMLRSLGSLATFVGITLLQRTPESIVIFAVVIVLMYYGKMGVEEHARVNEIVFPLFLLSVISLPFLFLNDMSLAYLEPYLTSSYLKLGNAGLTNIGWYGDIIMLGAFLHGLSNEKAVLTAFRTGVILSTFLLTVIMFMMLMVIGPNTLSRFIFPNYSLIQLIQITESLDRMELIFLVVWIPSMVMKIVFLFSAMLIALGSFAKKTNGWLYNKPFGLLLIISGLIEFNINNKSFFYSSRSTLIISILSQVVLLIVFLVSFRHRNREKSRIDRNERLASLYRRWNKLTNLWLVVSLITVMIGLSFAKYAYWIGAICAAVFSAALIIATISSHYELKYGADNHP